MLALSAVALALTAPTSIEDTIPLPSSVRNNNVETPTTPMGAPVTCTYEGATAYPCVCSNGQAWTCGGVAQTKTSVKTACMSADAKGCYSIKDDGTCDSDKYFCGQYSCSTIDPFGIGKCPNGTTCQEIHGDDFKGVGLCL